jgi:hypothetical protein
MMFDCVELVTQQLRNFRVCGHGLKLCLGKMSDGKLAVLHQRHRCVYHGRQLGRSGVALTALHGKENSIRHQMRFHSVVGASLYQRNLAAFSPAAFAARHRFFPSCRVHRQRRGKCHGHFSIFSRQLPPILAENSPADFGGVDSWHLKAFSCVEWIC